MDKKKVLLGMSGGVDSSVSAILLKEQGYEVIGATLKLLDNIDSDGNEVKSLAVEDAKKVCEQLGIEHHVIDAKEIFKDKVIKYFVCGYTDTNTPNPCVECNKYIKFGMFYQKAMELGCDFLSTGHYAKIEYSEKYGQNVLRKSGSINKDQTYFLYGINKEVLDHLIFPLQNYELKDEVRNIARQNNLAVADKSESQEICFIPDDDYIKYLYTKIEEKPKPGDIVLEDGTVLGKHNGLIHYTVGQRKGLGIAYKEPLYVISLDQKENRVIVGPEEKLYTDKLETNDINFLVDISKLEKNEDGSIKLMARIRYRAKEANARLYLSDDKKKGTVIFEENQRAITPGQSVVFYVDNILIGGGKIKNFKKL